MSTPSCLYPFYFSLMVLLVTAAWNIPGESTPGTFTNPTGTYFLQTKRHKENEDGSGYSGEIRTKLIARDRIVLSLIVNKGAPSYDYGTAMDTLKYKSNQAIYKTEEDSSCQIIFTFFQDKVIVKENTADVNSGCGFGHAVDADGTYKKISNSVPRINRER